MKWLGKKHVYQDERKVKIKDEPTLVNKKRKHVKVFDCNLEKDNYTIDVTWFFYWIANNLKPFSF